LPSQITEFKGQYGWLSNFYPCETDLAGIVFPTVEHAYQAAKSNSRLERAKIALAPTPGQAKRMGSKLFTRPNWDRIKLPLMESLLRQKFGKEPFKAQLMETGDALLAEGNYWGDDFWGVCPTGKMGADGQVHLSGQNHLGKLLMKIRDEQKTDNGRETGQ
jgi:ribA/ribD-fused uncharacterized protein